MSRAQQLVRVLVPVAVTGLGLAAAAGGLLFSVRAREYAGVGFLQAKLALVALGTLAALALHHRHGFLLESAGETPGWRTRHPVAPLLADGADLRPADRFRGRLMWLVSRVSQLALWQFSLLGMLIEAVIDPDHCRRDLLTLISLIFRR